VSFPSLEELEVGIKHRSRTFLPGCYGFDNGMCFVIVDSVVELPQELF